MRDIGGWRGARCQADGRQQWSRLRVGACCAPAQEGGPKKTSKPSARALDGCLVTIGCAGTLLLRCTEALGRPVDSGGRLFSSLSRRNCEAKDCSCSADKDQRCTDFAQNGSDLIIPLILRCHFRWRVLRRNSGKQCGINHAQEYKQHAATYRETGPVAQEQSHLSVLQHAVQNCREWLAIPGAVALQSAWARCRRSRAPSRCCPR